MQIKYRNTVPLVLKIGPFLSNHSVKQSALHCYNLDSSSFVNRDGNLKSSGYFERTEDAGGTVYSLQCKYLW